MNKVLIVDDSQELLKPIALGLQQYNSEFKILTASNGEEALEILGKEPISTLVTDLYMPKMDGITTLKHMYDPKSYLPPTVMLSTLTKDGAT